MTLPPILCGLLSALMFGSALGAAQQDAAGQTLAPSPSAREAAQVDLTGNWVSLITEDWQFRMVTPARGEYSGLPMSPAARKIADSWNAASGWRWGPIRARPIRT